MDPMAIGMKLREILTPWKCFMDSRQPVLSSQVAKFVIELEPETSDPGGNESLEPTASSVCHIKNNEVTSHPTFSMFPVALLLVCSS